MANIALEKKLCCGCHGCAEACPKNCIEMAADSEGFFYPKVDESRCIHCDLCAKICPVLNAKPDNTEKTPDAWAAMNREKDVRRNSSSGGVFTLLAQKTLGRGGVVFGAAWSEDYRTVRHIAVRTVEALSELRGSKYVQSSIGDCYQQAKETLESGKPVLFSGTPCQIEGLRCFLGGDYAELLCVDIVCHGVPAPAVWGEYLKTCERNAGAPVSDVKFRNKEPGWKNYTVKLSFQNGAQQVTPVSKNPYMRAFLRNACLRPSCYDCRFKKHNRVSDLTLADFWGIEEVCPEMDDNRGTSLVLVHTDKGRLALSSVEPMLRMEKVDATAALKFNPSAVSSSPAHDNRQAFIENYRAMGVPAAVKKYLREKRTAKSLVASVLGRLGVLDTVKKVLGRG